jgi:dephospho-CoA kinase
MILGITGISGSGKHTAGDFLKQKGWVILDADKIAHYLYRPYTSVWKAISKHFGEGILTENDKIDRKKLGDIVFDPSNPNKLKELNQITHPEIKRHIKNEIHYLRKKKPNVIVIGSLWKEIGLPEYCDKILLVTANEKLAFERIKKRDGVTQDAFNSRIKNQIAPPNPDFTVVNEADFQDLYKELNQLPIQTK